MIFNSIDFAIFLPIVFTLYWLIKDRKSQNLLIVLASYIFYGWWDWRFLSLIVFSTFVDYVVGLKLASTHNSIKRKGLLFVSIIVNLGFLGFFKYYNFFIENFNQAFSLFGNSINGGSLYIILPVGISFYTFQTLSYTIDVYRHKLSATDDFMCFAAFVSFFPQLVAGPIERATNLLPQFLQSRSFRYDLAVNGLRQIMWGLFKKMVIADNCAQFANVIFDNSESYSGLTLFIGALMFAFQIYGDFSGYSDIAIGTARLFGFNLMKNFASPYFSRDIAEFWRRWHISLSTWFRDYLYIPLGGSRVPPWKQVRNIFIIFIVSGFWHGANWTFIAWGMVNAFYFLPLLLTNKNRTHVGEIAPGRIFPSPRVFLNICITFLFTNLAWVFFRAENISHAVQYLGSLAKGLLSLEEYEKGISFLYSEIGPILILLILIFFVIEWLGKNHKFAIEYFWESKPQWVRYAFYYTVIFTIFLYSGDKQEFIYFQF